MRTHARVLHDGAKNLLVLVRGMAHEGESLAAPLDLRELSSAPRRVRLEGITWFIQEKVGLSLWLSRSERGPEQLLLVLESRGWSKFQDLVLPDGWDGRIWLESFGQASSGSGLFWLALDFDKVG